jgi:hypothetical protein
VHTTIDCIEALFSTNYQTKNLSIPAHFTLGSVPPGNGFPTLGVVAGKPMHFVSPFAPQVAADMRADHRELYPQPLDPDKNYEEPDRGGVESLYIPRLTVAGSPNGSWIVTGTVDWLPGIYKWHSSHGGNPCHKFHALCTESVLGVHIYGAHSVARTISFYGLGPASPPTKYTFGLDQSYGGVQVRMPIIDAFVIAAQVEGRHPEVPVESYANSVSTNFTPTSLPGLTAQPTYVHSSLGFTTQYRKISEPSTEDQPDTSDASGVPQPETPLFKHRTSTTVQGEFEYHWYADTSSSHTSFQQLTAAADLTINLGAVTQKGVDSSSAVYGIIAHYCGGSTADPRIGTVVAIAPTEIKRRDRCDFGTIEFRSHLSVSSAQTGNIIPFYMLPTVGGQDINSLTSLRGFDNYRFRGNDTTFLQAEYTIPVYDPVGLLIFYDAGNAGNSLSALSFAHIRQDAGFGLNFRISRIPVAQVYLAGGSGNGLHPGFTLAKRF